MLFTKLLFDQSLKAETTSIVLQFFIKENLYSLNKYIEEQAVM